MISIKFLPLFVIIPLGSAFILNIFERKVKLLTDLIASIASGALFVLSILMFGVKGNYYVGGWPSQFGITLVIDGLSSYMLVTINMIAFIAILFSINYMEKFTFKSRYYSLLFLMLAGMNGVSITGDIFNMYVFLEIAAIASYALVGYGGKAEELEASFKYAVMGTVSSTLILLGIALIYSQTSALNMAVIGRTINTSDSLSILALIFLFAGFGLKAAVVPFHAWLPDAHSSAPAPISAILSGILIKTIGIYLIVRIGFNIFGVSRVFLNVLLIVGALSAIIGVLLAIGQMDIKRLLAYHSISQTGYILLGIGLGTPLGIMGGLFHLLNHATFKSLLFLNSGSVEYSTGVRDLEKMGGLSKRMPVTGVTNLIASMSIAGIPPLNGFWSKLLIFIACIQAGYLGYAIIVAIVAILTLSSFLKVQKYAFTGDVPPNLSETKEAPFFMKTSMIFLATMCILLSLIFIIPSLREAVLQPATNVLTSGKTYIDTVLKGQGGIIGAP